jgi:flagellar FliL protein
MATEQAAPESEESTPAPKKKGGGLFLVLIAVIALGGAGGAGWFFFLRAPADGTVELAAAEEEVHAEPVYFTLAENLVVNFQSPGGTRFLQVGIDLMTYSEESAHTLEKHASVLRSSLILLLSDQTQETLLSREGKEQLRAAALADVQHSMKELDGHVEIEALYFTSFVMQ